MIWEETYGNTVLRVTLTSTFLALLEEAFTASTTTAIQQVTVAAAMAVPTAALVSVSLYIVKLKAKAAVLKL